MYHSAVEDRRGNFTPFVQSVDGLLQHEASHFIKAGLASKWEQLFSEVLAYVCSRHLFALIKSASICLREPRVVEDGAPHLQFVM